MIRLPFFSRRKRIDAAEKAAAPAQPATPAKAPERPLRFIGAAPERTQDLLQVQDGERVGFRKPVES